MAYSLMAGLPPINGLYVSFFSVIAYFFLGTSRHLSLGTYGVVSLMVRTTLDKYEGRYFAATNEAGHKRWVSNDGVGIMPVDRDYSMLSNYNPYYVPPPPNVYYPYQHYEPNNRQPFYPNQRDAHLPATQSSQASSSTEFISSDPTEAKVMIAR